MKTSIYAQIGEARLRELVKVFYDIVETDPNEGAVVHRLHLKGHGMNHTRAAQLEYLTGFLGGPKDYAQRHGHADIRLIHEHVEVGHEAKTAWLKCMERALNQVGFEAELKERLTKTFERAAEMARNRD